MPKRASPWTATSVPFGGSLEQHSAVHTKREPGSPPNDKAEVRRPFSTCGDITGAASDVTVTLANPDLWQAFHAHGTEMVVNRPGRYVKIPISL